MTFVQVQFAIDNRLTAELIVESLLEDRLIACGQIVGPVSSRYWWNDRVERADEWLGLLKTRSELATRVIAAVSAEHPYETPEVIVVDIAGGAPGYLGWISATTTATSA